MNESDKKTVYVNEEVSPDESLPMEQAHVEHDATSEVSSEKDFEEQEIPVEEDLTKLFSQNIDVQSENGYASGGYGGGYASDDASSINTDEILKVDPLYLRLTKFLQTEDGESVANTLKKINNQLELLNTNLINANTTTQI
jgi:hypothetical protein